MRGTKRIDLTLSIIWHASYLDTACAKTYAGDEGIHALHAGGVDQAARELEIH